MAELLAHTERTDSGWWEVSARPPALPLRGLVSRYLGYREHATVPVRRREIPTGRVGLIVSLGPSIRVHDPSRPVQTLTSFVAGVGARWAETEYVGDQHGVQIDVSPLVAGMIVGSRIGELGEQPVDLLDALGVEGVRLIERLLDAEQWAGRFEVLDRFILDRLARAHAPSPAAMWAWQALRETEGTISIAALAQRLGCSTRYLCAQVRAHVGVAPKVLARVLRVQHAIRLLDSGQSSLAAIAAVCGYADQSHMGRDFLDITGVSPGSWARAASAVPIPSILD